MTSTLQHGAIAVVVKEHRNNADIGMRRYQRFLLPSFVARSGAVAKEGQDRGMMMMIRPAARLFPGRRQQHLHAFGKIWSIPHDPVAHGSYNRMCRGARGPVVRFHMRPERSGSFVAPRFGGRGGGPDVGP